MGIHDGHRNRARKSFVKHGLDSLEDYQALELLLFYAIPRGDVNPLAHRLINKFGSLAGVFDAPEQELRQVEGVGESTASLIILTRQLVARYMHSKACDEKVLGSVEEIGRYIMPYLYGRRDEAVYMLAMDVKGKVLGCRQLASGSFNSASVSVRKVVEAALNLNASIVVLAHNHTSGMAVPSEEDRESTRRVSRALAEVDVKLLDHLVIADNDFVSMAASGLMD